MILALLTTTSSRRAVGRRVEEALERVVVGDVELEANRSPAVDPRGRLLRVFATQVAERHPRAAAGEPNSRDA